MADAGRDMADLSRGVAGLERRLGELAGELAEMKHTLGSLIKRYQREVLPYHRLLVETQRQISDLHLMLGDRGARSAGDANTALSSLVTNEGYASVQEQYERVWKGKRPPRPEDLWEGAEMPPAQEEIKALYVEIVAAVHPALAESSEDREHRWRTFKRVNAAYVARNRPVLGAIAAAYRERSLLPTVVGEGAVRRLRAHAAALEQVIARLEGQVYDIRYGDVAKVLAYAHAAEERGVDLIEQLGKDLRRELTQAREELARLRERVGE